MSLRWPWTTQTGAVDIRRRSALPLIAAWVTAAVLAVGVASWGVALVGRSVTDSHPAPLSASQIDDRLEVARASTTTAPDPSTTTNPDGDPGATTTSGPPTSDVTQTTPPPTSTDGSSPTTAASTPTTTSPPPTTTTAPTAETRTYSVQGGSVALRFASTGVTVVFANPAAGFDVSVEPENGNGVKVEFEGEGHKSIVEGWWDGGPRDRVREEAESESD